MRRTILLLLLALLFAAPAAAQAGDTLSVRPGDVFRLVVWRQAELSGDIVVGPNGTLLHPLYTDVRVVGMTRQQIQEQLRTVLSQYERQPQFVFDFLHRVGVGGEVRLPNLYPMSPETTLLQAVATAGGGTESARLDRAVLLRDGREMELNLLSPTPEVAAMRVRSGDQIRIPRRSNVVREYVGIGSSIVAALSSFVAAVLLIQRR
jgi:polysaccharide export outer membrane protein